MRELDVQPKHSMGQNFLIDEYVIHEIVNCVRELPVARIVEVGPGLGALTDELLHLKKPLVAIELDRKFADYWRGRELRVIETDALKIDKLSFNESNDKAVVQSALVSNLPYQIASRLVIEQSFAALFDHMVLMFQKEVADRLMATPRSHDFGLLSVIAQTFWAMEVVVDASAESFYPKPKISSRVLKFVRKAGVHVDRGFLSFIKCSFQYRRKFLTKNLKDYGSQVKGELTALGLNERARPEELSVEQFLSLYRNLSK